MAEPIQEYLVSIRYAIDAASQQQFLGALKNVTAGVTGVKRSILDLVQALLEMTEQMARAGEKLYWASQRMGSSVSDLQRTAAAMSNLGVSADAAMQSMESFGNWTRSMGPAGIAYLQRLGITATDTAGRMRQLGQFLRNQGFMPGQEGTLGYTKGLQYLRMFGISEDAGRAAASGEYGRQEAQYGLIQRLIWGKDVQSGPQKFATQSVVIMDKFRELTFIFDQMRQKVGLMLFEKLGPLLDKIRDGLIKAMPYFETGITYFGLFIELIGRTIEHLGNLPPAFGRMIAAMAALPGVLALMKSPLFWLITALTTLMILIDDYATWKSGGKTLFDWTKFDKGIGEIGKMLEPFLKMKEEFDKWFKDLTGIEHASDWIIGLGAAFVALTPILGGVATALGGIVAMLTGPAGIVVAAAAAAAAIYNINAKGQDKVYARAKQMGFEVDMSNPHAPVFTKDGNKFTFGDMLRMMGMPNGMSMGQAAGTSPMPWEGPGGLMPTGQEEYPLPGPETPGFRTLPWYDPRRYTTGSADNIGTTFQTASAGSAFFTGGAGSPDRFRGTGEFGNFLADYVGRGGGNNSPFGGGSGAMGPAAGAGDLRDMIAAKLGISKEAAAGIVSNMQAESGLRADINERNPVVPGSRGGYGLVQWTAERRVRLENWARERGLDVSQHETQVEFMKWELDKYYPNWRQAMGGTGSAGEFAGRFNQLYVRAPGAATHQRRVASAAGILEAPSGSMRPSLHASADVGGKGGVTNTTTINLTAPDPVSGADRVRYEQNRIHQNQTRRAAGMRTR